jgi:hypothetical protein
VVTHRLYLEAAGGAVVLLSVLWAIINWRRHLAQVRPARLKVSQPRGAAVSGRSRGSRPGWRARMMERMEERWRRRQEGDRRM